MHSALGEGVSLGLVEIEGWIILSGMPCRIEHMLSICSFRRFNGIVVYLLANDPFRSFIQVLIECVPDLQEFWPQNVVD